MFNFDYSHNCSLLRGWADQLCAKHVYLLSDSVQRAEMIALLCIFPFTSWHHWVLRTTSLLMCFGDFLNCASCICSLQFLCCHYWTAVYSKAIHSFLLVKKQYERGFMLWNIIACYDRAASSTVLLRCANSHCGWELDKAGMIGLLSPYNYFICLCLTRDLCGDHRVFVTALAIQTGAVPPTFAVLVHL